MINRRKCLASQVKMTGRWILLSCSLSLCWDVDCSIIMTHHFICFILAAIARTEWSINQVITWFMDHEFWLKGLRIKLYYLAIFPLCYGAKLLTTLIHFSIGFIFWRHACQMTGYCWGYPVRSPVISQVKRLLNWTDCLAIYCCIAELSYSQHWCIYFRCLICGGVCACRRWEIMSMWQCFLISYREFSRLLLNLIAL